MLPLVSELVADHTQRTQRGHTASAQGTLRHRRHPTSSGWSGDTQVLARTSCEGAGTHRISHTGRSDTAGTHRFGTRTPRGGGGHTGLIPRKAPLHGSFCAAHRGDTPLSGPRQPRPACHWDPSMPRGHICSRAVQRAWPQIISECELVRPPSFGLL